MPKHLAVVALISLIGLGMCAGSASANSISFTSQSGPLFTAETAGPVCGSTGCSSSPLKATALFEVSGSNLIITLTNAYTGESEVPSDILTAVFFNLAGNPALTKVSAALGPGSDLVPSGSPTNAGPPDGNVGGEWAYRGNLTPGTFPAGWTPAQKYGISSTGVDIFGPTDLFIPKTDPTCEPGNLDGPCSPDGLQYGILSMDGKSDDANGGVADTILIQNSVVFVLSGLPSGFDPSTDVMDVRFLYGTAMDAPVPEPASIFLLGSGMLGLAGLLRRRERRGQIRA